MDGLRTWLLEVELKKPGLFCLGIKITHDGPLHGELISTASQTICIANSQSYTYKHETGRNQQGIAKNANAAPRLSLSRGYSITLTESYGCHPSIYEKPEFAWN